MAFAEQQGPDPVLCLPDWLWRRRLNGATNALAADVSEGERGANSVCWASSSASARWGCPAPWRCCPNTFSLTGHRRRHRRLVLLPVVYFLLITFPPPKQQAQPVFRDQRLALLKQPIFLLAGSRAGDPERHGRHVQRLDDPLFQKGHSRRRARRRMEDVARADGADRRHGRRPPCPQRPAQKGQITARAFCQHRPRPPPARCC